MTSRVTVRNPRPKDALLENAPGRAQMRTTSLGEEGTGIKNNKKPDSDSNLAAAIGRVVHVYEKVNAVTTRGTPAATRVRLPTWLAALGRDSFSVRTQSHGRIQVPGTSAGVRARVI
jgi:hypothetical protein